MPSSRSSRSSLSRMVLPRRCERRRGRGARGFLRQYDTSNSVLVKLLEDGQPSRRHCADDAAPNRYNHPVARPAGPTLMRQTLLALCLLPLLGLAAPADDAEAPAWTE